MGCVTRPQKNYLRSHYLDKEKWNQKDSRKYSRFEIPPPVKVDTNTEKPKEKHRLLPFGKKDSNEKSEKVDKAPATVKVEAKKKFRLWPFGKKASNEKPATAVPGSAASSSKNYADTSSSKGLGRKLVPASEPYRYLLKYGDPIVINLRGIPDSLPVEERIDENGNIKLDYIGSVHALGKTSAELEEDIERAYLEQKIYRNLSVSVELPERSYFIRGEVLKPGRFSLLGGVSIVQAIATAGGFNDFANPKDVLIIRGGRTIKVNVRDVERNPARDVQIEEGDVIVVGRSFL